MLPDGEFAGPPPPFRCAEQIRGGRLPRGRPAADSDAQGDADRARRPACAMPLLRALHARLRCRRHLHDAEYAAAARDAHRPPDTLAPTRLPGSCSSTPTAASTPRRWSIARPGRRRDPRAHVRRELRIDRVGAAAAQLRVHAASERPRQLERSRRPLPDRPRRRDSVRISVAARGKSGPLGERGALDHSYIPRSDTRRQAGICRRLRRPGAIRRSGLPSSRLATCRFRRRVQGRGEAAAAGAAADGRLRQGPRASGESGHGGRVADGSLRHPCAGHPFAFGDNDRALFADMMDRLSAIYDKAGVETVLSRQTA